MSKLVSGDFKVALARHLFSAFLRMSYVLKRIYAGAERLSMAHSIMHSQKRPPWFTTEGRLLSGVVSFLILKIMREAHNFSKPLFPRIILSHSLKKKERLH